MTPCGHRFATLAPVKVYIRLADPLGPTFASAFDDLEMRTESVLTGELPDNAALHGVLARLRDLDVALLELRIENVAPHNDRSPVLD